MKQQSALGEAIDNAIATDPRFKRDRDSVQYAAFFKTLSGTSFLIERMTARHINTWLPENEAVKHVAEQLGLSVVRSEPNTSPDKYGRLSTIRTVPSLANAPLYRVQVTSPEQALQVLGALP